MWSLIIKVSKLQKGHERDLKEQVPKRIISISDLDSVENQLSFLNLWVLKLVVIKYCNLHFALDLLFAFALLLYASEVLRSIASRFPRLESGTEFLNSLQLHECLAIVRNSLDAWIIDDGSSIPWPSMCFLYLDCWWKELRDFGWKMVQSVGIGTLFEARDWRNVVGRIQNCSREVQWLGWSISLNCSG